MHIQNIVSFYTDIDLRNVVLHSQEPLVTGVRASKCRSGMLADSTAVSMS